MHTLIFISYALIFIVWIIAVTRDKAVPDEDKVRTLVYQEIYNYFNISGDEFSQEWKESEVKRTLMPAVNHIITQEDFIEAMIEKINKKQLIRNG